ncbi:unnamed protein product, partial [Laminaria digitata]
MGTPVKDGQLLAPFVYCVEVRRKVLETGSADGGTGGVDDTPADPASAAVAPSAPGSVNSPRSNLAGVFRTFAETSRSATGADLGG